MTIRPWCGNCGRTNHHAGDCNPSTTQRIPMTRVMPVFQPDQLPREPRTGRAGAPRWSVAVTLLGAVLMAVGFCLNHPVSQLVWEAVR
jgi:hypothetical protein